MKKIHKLGMTAACTAIAAGVLWLCFGEKIKILHTSSYNQVFFIENSRFFNLYISVNKPKL